MTLQKKNLCNRKFYRRDGATGKKTSTASKSDLYWRSLLFGKSEKYNSNLLVLYFKFKLDLKVAIVKVSELYVFLSFKKSINIF